MLNTTGMQTILTEFGLDVFFTFLYIVSWIGVAVLLIVIVVYAVRLIGKVMDLPVNNLFESVKILMERTTDQIKDKKHKQKPFSLSMLGITIIADGFTGKIIFIALLGTIATTAGSLVVGLEDFNPVPSDWYNVLNTVNNQGG